MNITPVILSGGFGTRLWPLSRKCYPKQYLPLISNNTMLQDTILRLKGIKNVLEPIIVCNDEHRFLVAEQCRKINITNPQILLEPVARNTAPAIAVAALQALQTDNSILLVLSADHSIGEIDAFHHAINIAIQHATKGRLVTFGILPTNANTGYGYIQKGDKVNGVYKVKQFREKPNQQTAKSFLKSNDYLWNSGMFVFRAETLINELKLYAPEIVKSVKKSISNSTQDLDFIRLNKESFASLPNISIDFALMEKSNNVFVVPLEAKWSDVGSWSSLYNIGEQNKDGNVIFGDVITEQTTNSYINANSRIVATIGVQDLIIVDTSDALLVSSREKVQELTKIVQQLKDQNKKECTDNRKVYRPWGWYDSIEMGLNFQVKMLHINPKSKLSLQMHHKRAEHWVVVTGSALVTKDNKEKILNIGDSIYIPIGVRHSIENKTSKVLEIIEVQSGTYIGEDDIVRFEDIYGRLS